MLDYYKSQAASYGTGLEDFVQTYLGLANIDALLEKNRAEIDGMATFSLIVQAIAEDAEITLSDEEAKEFFVAAYSEDEYNFLIENAGASYVKMVSINLKILEHLQENVILA